MWTIYINEKLLKFDGLRIGGVEPRQAFAWRAGDRDLHSLSIIFHN